MQSTQKNSKNGLITICSGAVASGSLPALPPGEEIYDIMKPVFLPYPWLQMSFKLLLLMFLCYLLYRFWCWLIAEPVVKRKRIIQSPEKLAMRSIERLKLSPVWESRQMKEICETLVLILKNYIKDAHEIGLGAAATSDEMLLSLEQEKIPANLLKQIAELFEICDRIKYTGQVYEADAENLLGTVKTLVLSGGW